MSSSRLIAFALLTLAACGSDPGEDPPDETPDAAAPDVDAGPDPDPVIGVGDPACQGASNPNAAVDIGPVLPDEIGDHAAARITPPSYPYRVDSVSYKLTGQETTCGTDIAHAVIVFAGPSADFPPATPDGLQRIEVAGLDTDERVRIVTVDLPTPIVLEAGQDLFVGVEMDANEARTVSICLDGCPLGGEDHRQYWSSESEAPFSWATLYSYGIAEDYAIWASGEAL